MNRVFKYFSVFFLLIAGLLISCQQEQKTIKTLIISGQNNHTWKSSTPILQEILSNAGIFEVEQAISPKAGEDMSSFKPVFADYDLVVLDYNGDAWPVETQNTFVDFVKSGGGVVVYHAADNAFPEWEAYNKIIGLGGWGNRNEASGPYVYYQDNELVKDPAPGNGGSHGAQHEFLVKARNTEHPIMKGLPEEWLHAQDELYQQLRGPAENLEVLATAFADTAKGGTGRNEPVLFTVEYGKGKIFHTVIGHAMGEGPHPAMECIGFITTLQRGAEWAATGKVSIEVPEAFPRKNTSSRWPDFRALSFDELLGKITNYKIGDDRLYLADISASIRNSDQTPETMKEFETKIIEYLNSDASADSKNYLCREISRFGSKAIIPNLEKLLDNPETQEMAKFAIERIKE